MICASNSVFKSKIFGKTMREMSSNFRIKNPLLQMFWDPGVCFLLIRKLLLWLLDLLHLKHWFLLNLIVLHQKSRFYVHLLDHLIVILLKVFLLSYLEFRFDNLFSHAVHPPVCWISIKALISLCLQWLDFVVDAQELVDIIVLHFHVLGVDGFFKNCRKPIHLELHLDCSYLWLVGVSPHGIPEFLLENLFCLVFWLNRSSFSLGIFNGSNNSKTWHNRIVLRQYHNPFQNNVEILSLFSISKFFFFFILLLLIEISNHNFLVSMELR